MFIERSEAGKPGEFADDKETVRKRVQERGVKLGRFKVVGGKAA